MGKKWTAADFENTSTNAKTTTGAKKWTAADFEPKPTTVPTKAETTKQKSDNINSLMSNLFVDSAATKPTTKQATTKPTPAAFKPNAIKQDNTFKTLATSNLPKTTAKPTVKKGTVSKAVPTTNPIKAAIINTNPKNTPLAFKPNSITPTPKSTTPTLPQAVNATKAIKTENKKEVKQQAIKNQYQKQWNNSWNNSDQNKFLQDAKNSNPVSNLLKYGTSDIKSIENKLKNDFNTNYKQDKAYQSAGMPNNDQLKAIAQNLIKTDPQYKGYTVDEVLPSLKNQYKRQIDTKDAQKQSGVSAFANRTLGNIVNAAVGQEAYTNNVPANAYNAGKVGNAISDFLGMSGYALNPMGLGEAPMATLGKLVGNPTEKMAAKLIGKGENVLANKVGNAAIKKAIQSQAVNKVVNPILSSAVRGGTEMAAMNSGLTALNGGNAKQIIQSGLEGAGQGALWGGGLKGLGIGVNAAKPVINNVAKEFTPNPNLVTRDMYNQNMRESPKIQPKAINKPSATPYQDAQKIIAKRNGEQIYKPTPKQPKEPFYSTTNPNISPDVVTAKKVPIKQPSELVAFKDGKQYYAAHTPNGVKLLNRSSIKNMAEDSSLYYLKDSDSFAAINKNGQISQVIKSVSDKNVSEITRIIPSDKTFIEPTSARDYKNTDLKSIANKNITMKILKPNAETLPKRTEEPQSEINQPTIKEPTKANNEVKQIENKPIVEKPAEVKQPKVRNSKYKPTNAQLDRMKKITNAANERGYEATFKIGSDGVIQSTTKTGKLPLKHTIFQDGSATFGHMEKKATIPIDLNTKPMESTVEKTKTPIENDSAINQSTSKIPTEGNQAANKPAIKPIEKSTISNPNKKITEMTKEELFSAIDNTKAYENYKPTKTVVDWGSLPKGQGKRVGKTVVGGMSNQITGKKTYSNILGNVPEIKTHADDFVLMNELDKFNYLKAREYGLNHEQALLYADEKGNNQHRKSNLSNERIMELMNKYDKTKPSKSEEVIRKSVNTNSPIDKIDIQQGTGETKSRKEIVDNLFETLGIPHRVGRIRGSKGILGIYKTKSEVIRTRFDSDLSVIPHEFGHHLDKLYSFTDKAMNDRYIKAEMMKAGSVQGKIQKMVNPKDQIGEGLADFVKYYISKPEYAQKEFPKFYDHFEKTVDQNIKTALLDYRNDYKKYINADPEKRLNAQMSINQKVSKIEKLKAIFNKDKLATDWLDSLNPIKQMVEENNPNVKAIKNPYKIFKNMSGWENKAEAIINYGIKDKSDRQVSEGLASILEPIKSDINEFRNYIVAKRVIEKDAQGIRTGVHIEDAEYTVNKYSNNTKFNEAFKKLQTFQDALLQNAVESGLISSKQYQAMKDSNKDYVPFYRVLDDAKGGFVGKDKIAGATSPVKRMKGSEKQIIDPLESIIKNVYLMTNSIERNNAMNVLVDYTKSMNGMGKYVEEVPPKMMPQHMQIADVKRQLKDLGMDVTDEAADGMLTMFNPLFKGDPQNCIIPIMRDGKTKLYQLDPDVYRAVMGQNKEQTNFIMKLLSAPAKTLRAGAVLSPNFAVRNPIRDTMDAGIYSRYGFKPVIDTVKGLYHVIGKDDIYQTYMESGAGFSNAVSLDRNRLQENLNKLLSESTVIGNLKNFTHSPLLPLRMLSEVMEEATRVGEFSLGLKKEGNTPSGRLNASLAAKDVTLNFGEFGDKAKQANSIIAFFNAKIKGEQKIYNELFNPKTPAKRRAQVMTKAMAMVTVPTIMNWLYVNSDEKRKKAYQEEPEWRKQIFWVIPTEGSMIYIPKPPAIGILFGSSVEKALDFANNNDKDAPGELAKQIFDDTAMTISDFIPTGMKPAIENLTNHSFFYGNTLVPDSLSGVSPKYQYTKGTNNISKIIGGAANISPIKIDNFIRGYFGGTGTLAMNTASMATGQNLFSKKTNIPVVGAFVNDQYSNPQSLNDFYENKNKLMTKYKDFKADNTSGLTGKEYGLYKAFIKSGTIITNIKKVITNLQNSKDPDKDKKIKQLNNTILEIAQNMNKYYSKLK